MKVKIYVSGRPTNCREITYRLTQIKDKIEYVYKRDKADIIIIADNFNILNMNLKDLLFKIDESFHRKEIKKYGSITNITDVSNNTDIITFQHKE